MCVLGPKLPGTPFIRHVDAATRARLHLYFETMAFWIVIADHSAGHTLACGKRHELRDFVDGEIPGKELTHEKSF